MKLDKLSFELWEIIAQQQTLCYSWNKEDWVDCEVEWDFTNITNEPISKVLPVSYDGDLWIDSVWRFVDRNECLNFNNIM